MSIAFFISTLERGGSERVVSILANKFSIEGYKVYIFTLYDSNHKYHINENVIVKSLSLRRNSFDVLNKVKMISQTIKKFKINYTIALCSDVLNAIIIASKILYRCNTKIIATVRSNPIQKRSIFLRNLIFFFYRYSDHIVVQTKLMSNFVRSFKKERNISIIPNPIENKFTINPYKKKSDRIYDLLVVGRMNILKNHNLIIDALDILKSKNKISLKLCIVGRDDGEYKNLSKKITDVELNNNVFFAGEVDNVEKYYKKSKILLHVSFYEGMPNVIIESKKYGLPVIVSKFDGSDEMVTNRFDGMILSDFSPVDLSTKIKNLYHNDRMINEMSDNAFHSSSKYDLESVFKKWKQILWNIFYYQQIVPKELMKYIIRNWNCLSPLDIKFQ